MTEEKKNLVGPFGRAIVAFVAVMTIFSVGAITGMMIADENPKCPDCDLICPDVIDYREDYNDILSEILQRLNNTEQFDEQAILDAIYDMERNITYDISWLEWKVDWMDYYVRKIRNDTLNINLGQIPQYPRDYIMIVNYTENVSLQVEYYDNLLGYNLTSPTFTIQNWTEFMNWTGSLGDARIYPNQRLMIMLIGINMAYYKETGTWLGE